MEEELNLSDKRRLSRGSQDIYLEIDIQEFITLFKGIMNCGLKNHSTNYIIKVIDKLAGENFA